MTNQEKIDLLLDAIKELNGKNTDIEVTENTELADLGIDSLDAVELQLYIEDKLKMQTNDPSGSIVTVADFLKLFP